MEVIEKEKIDEKEYRVKINNIMSEVMYKLNGTIKETKAQTIIVKQGENAIEMMKDKNEKARIANVKF